MKPADPKVLEILNAALKQELTTINQYFLHARMLKDWGVSRLAKKEYDESIEEMHHADWIIERILFLDGLPNLQDLDKLFIGENVQEVIECDLKAEHRAHPIYKDGIAYFESVGDYVSRRLFADILKEEEEHIDWLETQLDLIGRIGLERYTLSNTVASPDDD